MALLYIYAYIENLKILKNCFSLPKSQLLFNLSTISRKLFYIFLIIHLIRISDLNIQGERSMKLVFVSSTYLYFLSSEFDCMIFYQQFVPNLVPYLILRTTFLNK